MARPPPKNLKYKSKINGWEATVTYVPSHRPKNRARVRRSYYRRRQRFFVMHNLKPSYIVPNAKGFARVFNVSTQGHKQLYLPKFPKSLLPDLDEYWGSMLVGVTNNDFRYKQYGKHGRHYKCGWRYLKAVVDIAKPYIEPGSDCELISVMQKKGFFPGYKYKCREFRKALNVGLRHRVCVMFKSSKKGFKYLHEISSLYHLDFSRWENVARRQKKENVKSEREMPLHLEDFSRRMKQNVKWYDLRTGVRLKHPKLQSRPVLR